MKQEQPPWYVRDGDRVTGPYTQGELNNRLRRGDLKWFHEVSQDRLIWVSASTLLAQSAEMMDVGTKRSSIGSLSARGVVSRWPVFMFGIAIAATVAGVAWFLRDGVLGYESKSNHGGAVKRVLETCELTSKETVKAVSANDAPSDVARAISEFLSRMHDVDTSDCPADFRVALKHHLSAWQDLHEAVKSLPDSFLEGLFVGALNALLRGEKDGGMSRMTGTVEQASRVVTTTYQDVEKIAAKYDVALP